MRYLVSILPWCHWKYEYFFPKCKIVNNHATVNDIVLSKVFMHTVVLIQCYTAIFIMIIWWYHLLLKTCLSQEAYSTWSIIYNMVCTSRVVLSEAVDWYICFTRKNQHGGYPKRSRPQGLNDCATSELSMRAWTWNVTDSEKTILDLIIEQYFQIWQSEEMARCGPVEGSLVNNFHSFESSSCGAELWGRSLFQQSTGIGCTLLWIHTCSQKNPYKSFAKLS